MVAALAILAILPEHSTRNWVAKHFDVSPYNDFALLDRIAGDCAGAISLLPPGVAMSTPEYRPLSEAELAQVLDTLYSKPLLIGAENLRQTLAGMQDKVAVAMIDGAICLPLNGSPSSHILKPASLRFGGIVQNEAFCMRLAAAIGLPAAHVETCKAGSIEYLLVERFDRAQASDGSLRRVHQEDFCQALNVAPESKYQSDGGPRLAQCFDLLRRNSIAPDVDTATLLDAVIFNYLIGNNDAHGKNFALLYAPEGVRLAPLYDLISTAVYSNLSTRMSMKIGDNYESAAITARDWHRFAAACRLDPERVLQRMKEVAGKTLPAAECLLLEYPAAASIVEIIRTRCSNFLNL
ncbi:MAG: type II toxin-antitoxin system HipA family toxin [Pseudomonadota bacterium]|nr:type II toxin-antitoxin system HipA family toxin [Pseudomonadota bacterium]MDE3037558.1 type II toxin-antitoxin system HipA family toxin [Pseudomonadota bacterium]